MVNYKRGHYPFSSGCSLNTTGKRKEKKKVSLFVEGGRAAEQETEQVLQFFPWGKVTTGNAASVATCKPVDRLYSLWENKIK